MNARKREDEALDAWRATLSRIEGSSVMVISRPDRESQGRGGCDALVERRGTRQAVEHTTIDGYLDQRQDTARYREVFMPLEERVAREFGDFWIEIQVPSHAVPTGQDWEALKERLFARICEAIRSMPVASFCDLSFTQFDFPDIPFPIWISRQELAGQAPSCFIGRDAPQDRREQLVAGIARALEDKAQQLRAYRRDMTTVLLLDFDDISLLNQYVVAESFAKAAKERPDAIAEIDEVYLVDRRRRQGIWVFPVKLGLRFYPDLPEFQAFRSEQFNTTYGR
jgi:hypothetical protein